MTPACDRGSVLVSNSWMDHATVSSAHSTPPLLGWHSKIRWQQSFSFTIHPCQADSIGLKRSDVISVSFVSLHHDDNYDDNGYNNSLALYLHYLSSIPMLFIVLLARGMSDHSIMSLVSVAYSFLCIEKRHTFWLWNSCHGLPTLPSTFDHGQSNGTRRFLHAESTRSHELF